MLQKVAGAARTGVGTTEAFLGQDNSRVICLTARDIACMVCTPERKDLVVEVAQIGGRFK